MKYLFILSAFIFLSSAAAEDFYQVENTAPGAWFLHSIRHSCSAEGKKYLAKLDKLDPYAERARCAETFHSLLEKHFRSNRFEDRAIEKALNWKKGDFTWHNNKFITEFFEVREKARVLLLANKRAEAVKLLDDVFRKHYTEANKFIDNLQKEVLNP